MLPNRSRQLPLIQEHLDEIYLIYTEGNNHTRVVFIRESELPGHDVVATRLLLNEMIWNVNSEAQIVLMWRDYWTASRVVTADPFYPTPIPGVKKTSSLKPISTAVNLSIGL